MSRYDTPVGVEGQYEPGSRRRVLRNLLGVKNKVLMDAIENERLIAVQERYYDSPDITEQTRFGSEMLCRMHRDWLGGVYEWAGRYRTAELAKGGFKWPPAWLVPANMERFERELLSVHTPCRSADLGQVCSSIAEVHAEFLLIHPFREGNGRLARWLADLMSVQAGLPPPLYRFTGKGSRAFKHQYLCAVIAGYGRDYEGLASFFEEAIRLRLSDET